MRENQAGSLVQLIGRCGSFEVFDDRIPLLTQPLQVPQQESFELLTAERSMGFERRRACG
jgi:hypothetical protein